MLEFLKSPRTYSLFASIALLVCTLFVLNILITHRPTPKQKIFQSDFHPKVTTISVNKGKQAIRVQTYGSVEPKLEVTLVAPYAGTVHAVTNLYPGRYLSSDETLFSLEKVKLELSIGQLQTGLDELTLKELQLAANEALLLDRVETTQALVDIAYQSRLKQEEQLANERQLYQNVEELYSKDAVSTTELLNQESKYLAVHVAYFEAKTREANVRNNLLSLKSEVNNTQFSLRNLQNQRHLLELKIGELQNDLKKADIAVDFPSQISEVFVDKEEEVSPGTKLATLRSIDSVEIAVNIPDSYFKWVYAGNLLQEQNTSTPLRPLDIILVNRGFRKHFKGGFIKSVADRVSSPTRSLSVLIERKNPRDSDGKIVATDELKPGMYCEVTIHLHELDDVFLIPRKALQKENHLYHVIAPVQEGQPYQLEIIKEVSILHESTDGVIVRLPSRYDSLSLVTEPLKRAWEGMEIELKGGD